MEGQETAVQFAAFGLKHADHYVDACFTELLDASALDLGKLVDAAYDHALNTFADDEVGTGRCLTEVGTGFKRDVDCSLGK